MLCILAHGIGNEAMLKKLVLGMETNGSNMELTSKIVIGCNERKEIGTLECIVFTFERYNAVR